MIVEVIRPKDENHKITIESFNHYVGVMFHARLIFKQQVEDVSTKASVVRINSFRFMPKVEGLK